MSTAEYIDSVVDRGVQSLRAAAANRPVTIFVDPTLADPLTESLICQEACDRRIARKVRLPFIHADIDPEKAPYLLHLEDDVAGERLLSLSVRTAVREATDDFGDGYRGRSVCGWICGERDPHSLAERLAHAARVLKPDGQTWPLRYWDPRVIWQLPRAIPRQHWSLLTVNLGAWWAIGLTHQLEPMTSPSLAQQQRADGKTPILKFDVESWLRLERIGPINKVLGMAPEWGNLPGAALAQRVESLLVRCAAAGFDSEQDGLVYCACALTSHERFDEHPDVKGSMKAALEEGNSLVAALSAFDAAFWMELSQGTWIQEVRTSERSA